MDVVAEMRKEIDRLVSAQKKFSREEALLEALRIIRKSQTLDEAASSLLEKFDSSINSE